MDDVSELMRRDDRMIFVKNYKMVIDLLRWVFGYLLL